MSKPNRPAMYRGPGKPRIGYKHKTLGLAPTDCHCLAGGERLVQSHEKCACGYCRCDHASGFGPCLAKGSICARYTWVP